MSGASAYDAAIQAAALFDLSERGKVEVAGPDARSFLHNLCTQDIKSFPVGGSCEAFLTTNKARVIAHVWMVQRDTDVLTLDFAPGHSERVFQHLNHYLISEQVELTNRTAELGMLRLVGPRAAEVVKQTALAPIRAHQLLALDGFDFLAPRSEIEGMRQRFLDAGAVPGSAETYNLLRVEAGLPEFGIDIDENRFCVEVNRTAQAICYTKGCYLGQETIVMARDRGQVNRLLMGVNFSAIAPPIPGTKLLRGADEVGLTASSVRSPRIGATLALAYLRRGSWDAGTELATTDGQRGVVCALPFSP